MPRRRPDGGTPSWSTLCKIAGPQAGYFNRSQAQAAGYSRQLMQYYISKALVERTARDGVFHITRYPRERREELIVLWLTTERRGVFSHETALWLHGLLDESPQGHRMTLPPAWRRRRAPAGAIWHLDTVPEAALVQVENLPVTTPLRSLADCLLVQELQLAGPKLAEPDGTMPTLQRAYRRALRRGVLTKAGLRGMMDELRRERPWLRASK